MSRTYSRDDVSTHSEGYGGRQYPAVNVKDYGNGAYNAGRKLVDRGVSEAVAEQAITYAVDSARETFWQGGGAEEYVSDLADRTGYRLKFYSAGRSGGWLIVQGLPEIEEWDAVMLGRWRSFEKRVRAECDYRMAEAQLLEDVDANRWAEPYAEPYNFFDAGNGRTVCVADLNRVKAEAAEKAAAEFLAREG